MAETRWNSDNMRSIGETSASLANQVLVQNHLLPAGAIFSTEFTKF